jgi:hypothetical protein
MKIQTIDPAGARHRPHSGSKKDFPHFAHGLNRMYAVNYSSLIPVLIQAVNELER